jgi:hypothetical protein
VISCLLKVTTLSSSVDLCLLVVVCLFLDGVVLSWLGVSSDDVDFSSFVQRAANRLEFVGIDWVVGWTIGLEVRFDGMLVTQSDLSR